MKLTNNTDISLSLAVWLATDDYDYNADPQYISATTLLKSIRQIILGSRITATKTTQDINNTVASHMGTALHNAIEHSWESNHKQALSDLGYPPGVIDKILINPTPVEIKPDSLCVYMERRADKAINNYIISGKFDFVMDGVLEDFKSMGTYGYTNNTNTEKFRLQGSIYRWLNPDIIKADYMQIQYLFTDWSALKAKIEANKGYPGHRLLSQKLTLLSHAQTESFINQKLTQIATYTTTAESALPLCTQEELWQSNPIFAYYKNPNKTTRSTAKFKDYYEAHARMIADGSVGVVLERKGTIKACNYCNAYNMCTQKDEYIANGLLKEN